MDNLRIAFIGSGSMGSAVLDGLLAAGHPKLLISATTRTEAKAKALRDRGISALAGETSPDANALMAADADLIVLGVKPYQIVDVLTELKGEIGKNAVVISMAAGIKLATMAAVLDENPNLIRTMPNTPSKIGLGVTGIAAGTRYTPAQLELISSMFSTVGEVIILPENKIDALGSISGSGPAYVFYFIEQLTEVALEHGFSAEQAEKMVQGTFRGAVELLAQSGEEPAELRRQVTSPKGSTERAIAVFDEADIKDILLKGTQAAIARSEEMARGE